jgi:hypothetical protein
VESFITDAEILKKATLQTLDQLIGPEGKV